MIVHPVWNRSCCCCCGPRRAANGGGSGGILPVGVAPTGGEESGAAGVGAEGPRGWRVRPQAGQQYRVPALLYGQLTRARTDPVRTIGRCGQSRDCVPGEGYFESYQASLGNGFAWIRFGGGRSWEIYSADGRVLLGTLFGGSGDTVSFLSTSRDERELQLIQSSPNAGRFGFLPP